MYKCCIGHLVNTLHMEASDAAADVTSDGAGAGDAGLQLNSSIWGHKYISRQQNLLTADLRAEIAPSWFLTGNPYNLRQEWIVTQKNDIIINQFFWVTIMASSSYQLQDVY